LPLAAPPAAVLAVPELAAPPLAAAPAGAEPATPLPETPALAAAPQQQAVLAPPAPPPRAARSFLWPVRGRVLATYGERGGGLHNDGINIAAAKGTPVHAAENGVVAYAGNEIRGFGNLLLIKHADGFMTAYAHNDALLVQHGDVVRRGQVVARVGQTGNVAQPQLHFEVRKGTQAIDPESVLGNPAAASAF
jgi:murein DD-endopeptidase MepM/ murein hydrolase activator NlpD